MMKRVIFAAAIALCLAPLSAQAQTRQTPALRDKLMPTGATALVVSPVPVVDSKPANERVVNQPMIAGGGGMGYMIAGGALFVAGLLVDGDAGTILILSGAGIGAYGLYLHFR